MELMDAIYGRRSVRTYTAELIGRQQVEKLIDAAIQAPSKMNAQPWAFAVVQDRALLTDYSRRCKAHLLTAYGDEPLMDRYRKDLSNSAFDIFYGAGTLVVIYARPAGLLPEEDCCLAAQNLMLVAHASGLGTCCIGWARPFLDLPEAKRELGVPQELRAVLPIIVGVPKEATTAPPRDTPQIIAWK